MATGSQTSCQPIACEGMSVNLSRVQHTCHLDGNRQGSHVLEVGVAHLEVGLSLGLGGSNSVRLTRFILVIKLQMR